MKEYNKLSLPESDIIVIDLEALNYTKEAISIGAVAIVYNEETSKFELREDLQFKALIKPQSKNRVDRIIESLTGISNTMLREQGMFFTDCIDSFKEYYSQFKNPLFLCYGNFDEIILRSSFKRCPNKNYNQDYNFITSRLIDYSKIVSLILRLNNTVSLINAINELELQQYGKHHDALNDAIDLANVFIEIENNKEKCIERTINLFIDKYPVLKKHCEILKNIIFDNANFDIKDFQDCEDKHTLKELIQRLSRLTLINKQTMFMLNKIKSSKDVLSDFLINPSNKTVLINLLSNSGFNIKPLKDSKNSFEENILYLRTIKTFPQKNNKELLFALLFFDIAKYYVNEPKYKDKVIAEITEEIVEDILTIFKYPTKVKKNIKFYINALNVKKITQQKLVNQKKTCNEREKYENILILYKTILTTKKKIKQNEIRDIDNTIALLK